MAQVEVGSQSMILNHIESLAPLMSVKIFFVHFLNCMESFYLKRHCIRIVDD